MFVWFFLVLLVFGFCEERKKEKEKGKK